MKVEDIEKVNKFFRELFFTKRNYLRKVGKEYEDKYQDIHLNYSEGACHVYTQSNYTLKDRR